MLVTIAEQGNSRGTQKGFLSQTITRTLFHGDGANALDKKWKND
jgi:hypothetical protein